MNSSPPPGCRAGFQGFVHYVHWLPTLSFVQTPSATPRSLSTSTRKCLDVCVNGSVNATASLRRWSCHSVSTERGSKLHLKERMCEESEKRDFMRYFCFCQHSCGGFLLPAATSSLMTGGLRLCLSDL